jgi:hypothetical protein
MRLLSSLPRQISSTPRIPITPIYGLADDIGPYPHDTLLLITHPDSVHAFPLLTDIEPLILLHDICVFPRLTSEGV